MTAAVLTCTVSRLGSGLVRGVLLSCWQRSCRQVTSRDRASRAMMASLMETLCCRTHIPACSAVGVVSPSLLELQLLPAVGRPSTTGLGVRYGSLKRRRRPIGSRLRRRR